MAELMLPDKTTQYSSHNVQTEQADLISNPSFTDADDNNAAMGDELPTNIRDSTESPSVMTGSDNISFETTVLAQSTVNESFEEDLGSVTPNEPSSSAAGVHVECRHDRKLPRVVALSLCVFHIGLGVILIFLGLAAIVKACGYYDVAAPIWTGFLSVTNGVVGMAATITFNNDNRTLSSHVLLSILVSFVCIVPAALSISASLTEHDSLLINGKCFVEMCNCLRVCSPYEERLFVDILIAVTSVATCVCNVTSFILVGSVACWSTRSSSRLGITDRSCSRLNSSLWLTRSPSNVPFADVIITHPRVHFMDEHRSKDHMVSNDDWKWDRNSELKCLARKWGLMIYQKKTKKPMSMRSTSSDVTIIL